MDLLGIGIRLCKMYREMGKKVLYQSKKEDESYISRNRKQFLEGSK